MRAIIIDDEQSGIETLKLLIERYLEDLTVVAECTRPGEAIALIENYKPEIIFLDISMPEMNGFELLEKMEWRNFHLIFTTAHQEHALKALKIRAMDYLLKPVDPADLVFAVNKVRQRIELEQNMVSELNYVSLNSIHTFQMGRLALSSKNGIEFIEPLNIVFLESHSNYTNTYLGDGRSILSPKTLGEFEMQLCQGNSNFMRVHNSFIINLQKIVRYTKDDDIILMTHDQRIPLAKSRREQFFKWLHA